MILSSTIRICCSVQSSSCMDPIEVLEESEIAGVTEPELAESECCGTGRAMCDASTMAAIADGGVMVRV